ncbi:type IV pilus modification PilV family protein [Glaciecola sp. MF2-115]|uniref:type IV pilus modification PilV family protein n=1 Tax=Glaciecola sp. MF2-115 TaxID=3384827 RepID=UPI0039A33D8F
MKPNKLTNNTIRKPMLSQRGLGMIEVLVTLFILSIGLLGVASLQFVGSFSNADALNRTQAVFVAQQFSERLSANALSSDVTDGFVVDNAYFDEDLYNFANLTCSTTGASPYDCHCKAHPSAIANCQTGDCDSAELAEFDAYQMSCAAVRNNPNAKISLTCTDKDLGDTDLCTAGSIHEVIVTWPVRNWQGNDRVLNAACNKTSADSNDCVVVEVAL